MFESENVPEARVLVIALIITLILIGLTESAHGQTKPLTLGVHTFSLHSNKDPLDHFNQNNVNLGGYVRYGDWVGGAYYNTLRRPSVYLGYMLEPLPTDRVALTLGFISGYQKERVEYKGNCPYPGYNGYCWDIQGYSDHKLSLMISPSVVLLRHDSYAARLGYVPRIGGVNRSSVYHLMFEKTFEKGL